MERASTDDFEPIAGIGHLFEKRLYDAGLCTYESLATATVHLLEEICQAPAQFKPDYAAWISKPSRFRQEKQSGKPRRNGNDEGVIRTERSDDVQVARPRIEWLICPL